MYLGNLALVSTFDHVISYSHIHVYSTLSRSCLIDYDLCDLVNLVAVPAFLMTDSEI